MLKFFFYFLSIFLIISCSGNDKNDVVHHNYNFEEIKTVLNGETLKSNHTSKTYQYSNKDFLCSVNYVGNGEKSNEANVIFSKTNTDSCYNALTVFYNKLFNSNRKDRIFNSWSTDSVEVLLYKQTDSTIFTNIFIKSYR